MKTHLFALTALLIVLTTSSCQKKPKASFSTDKESYAQGELISCKDKSTDAYSIFWTVKGPEEYRGKNPDFSFYPATAGNYEITQSCYSKNNKLSDKSTKSITVKGPPPAPNGSVIFYTTYHNSAINVFKDNVLMGTITQMYTSTPACGASNCVTLSFPPGSYQFVAGFVTYPVTKTYYVNILSNQCYRVNVNL